MSHRFEDRRPLAELRVLHEDLEPQIRDIYVEGRRDANFLRLLLRELGIPYTNVYPIDDRVEVPTERVFLAGGTDGAKGRVLALAAAVDEWGLSEPGVTCIVDSDFDHLIPGPRYDSLIATEFASLEGYVLQPAPFERLIRVGLGRSESPEAVLEWAIPALNELYVVRTVLHHHEPPIPMIRKLSTCVNLYQGRPIIDGAALITKAAIAGGASRDLPSLLGLAEEYRGMVTAMGAYAARGHDIAFVLESGLNLPRELANAESFERAVLLAVRGEDFASSEMIRRLRERLM